MEPQEQQQNRSVENRIEAPRAHAVTPASQEVQEENPQMANQVAAKQNDLAVDDEWEARAGQPNRGPEAVPVNHGVQQRRQQNRENLKRLRKLEPKEAHED